MRFPAYYLVPVNKSCDRYSTQNLRRVHTARYESDATRRWPRYARWRTEPLSTAPKVEPVSTLGALESGSVRHCARCERAFRHGKRTAETVKTTRTCWPLKVIGQLNNLSLSRNNELPITAISFMIFHDRRRRSAAIRRFHLLALNGTTQSIKLRRPIILVMLIVSRGRISCWNAPLDSQLQIPPLRCNVSGLQAARVTWRLWNVLACGEGKIASPHLLIYPFARHIRRRMSLYLEGLATTVHPNSRFAVPSWHQYRSAKNAMQITGIHERMHKRQW